MGGERVGGGGGGGTWQQRRTVAAAAARGVMDGRTEEAAKVEAATGEPSGARENLSSRYTAVTVYNILHTPGPPEECP